MALTLRLPRPTPTKKAKRSECLLCANWGEVLCVCLCVCVCVCVVFVYYFVCVRVFYVCVCCVDFYYFVCVCAFVCVCLLIALGSKTWSRLKKQKILQIRKVDEKHSTPRP